MQLSEEEGQRLIALARSAVAEYVTLGRRIDVVPFLGDPRLAVLRAVFVTLRIDTALRGCVGNTWPLYPLAQSVRDSAIAAAVSDSRFQPVESAELPLLRYELSVLGDAEQQETPFRRIRSVDEIVLGRDGLYVAGNGRSGLLLPQVATEFGWGVDEFLAGVCAKAGLPEDAWQSLDVRLFRFTAQSIRDGNSAGSG